MNTNERVVKTTMRVKECTEKIQNREQVRSRHFEPLIRDVGTVDGEKQEAVVANVAASKRNDEFLVIFVCARQLYCLGNNPDHSIGTRFASNQALPALDTSHATCCY